MYTYFNITFLFKPGIRISCLFMKRDVEAPDWPVFPS